MQYYPFDRLSVVSADPRIMMGNDSYAHQYYVWYSTEGASGIEPPPDRVIRRDKASQAGSLEEADAALNDLIGTFVNEGWVIGLVGEEAAPTIVRNDFHNLRDGLVSDDITLPCPAAAPIYPPQDIFRMSLARGTVPVHCDMFCHTP